MAYIGIDLGGTNIRGAVVKDNVLSDVISVRVSSSGTEQEVLEELFQLTGQLIHEDVKAIGIGVPSVVDIEKGIVYDVQNIPSWKEVPLKKYLEERYHVPVLVNNDANCFALGEKYFGQGGAYHSFIGLTIGTGMGAGIIIHDKLYAGSNCGSGEFGMVNYLDRYFEYYASGQFFKNVYQADGEEVFHNAKRGDREALKMFEELGTHIGNAIKMILYTYDPETIILGGSIKNAFPYYKESMWKEIGSYVYPKSLEKFRIKISSLKNSGVLGAAALCYEKDLTV
ncbi:MAG: ROK family protein [Chitinophagaceae bacterium]|nr:MAG: ROK family protein [Chitinophagaceae bacterium]